MSSKGKSSRVSITAYNERILSERSAIISQIVELQPSWKHDLLELAKKHGNVSLRQVLDDVKKVQQYARRGAAGTVTIEEHDRQRSQLLADEQAVRKAFPVEVFTGDYEFSHGHAPKGRGGWLFCKVDPRRHNDYLDHLLPNFNGTYTEAKKAAVAYCKQHRIRMIFVCA